MSPVITCLLLLLLQKHAVTEAASYAAKEIGLPSFAGVNLQQNETIGDGRLFVGDQCNTGYYRDLCWRGCVQYDTGPQKEECKHHPRTLDWCYTGKGKKCQKCKEDSECSPLLGCCSRCGVI